MCVMAPDEIIEGSAQKGVGGQIGRERAAPLAELDGHQEELARRRGWLLTERACGGG